MSIRTQHYALVIIDKLDIACNAPCQQGHYPFSVYTKTSGSVHYTPHISIYMGPCGS